MVNLLKALKRTTEKHPFLTAVMITIWIWYGFYHLGVSVGEFIANIKN